MFIKIFAPYKFWNYEIMLKRLLRFGKIYLHSISSSSVHFQSFWPCADESTWDVRKTPALHSFPDRLPPFDPTWLSITEQRKSKAKCDSPWQVNFALVRVKNRTLLAWCASEISFNSLESRLVILYMIFELRKKDMQLFKVVMNYE